MFYWLIHALQQSLDSHSGKRIPLLSKTQHKCDTSSNCRTFHRFSCTNRIKKDGGPPSSLLHCRSSGLRVSTAAGSTAAIHSAGGSTMPILCKELQYMVREPIFPGATSHLMHGFVKSSETMDISWFCREGLVYIDGSHVVHSVQLGDTIELSCRAPPLKVYLSSNLLSKNSV